MDRRIIARLLALLLALLVTAQPVLAEASIEAEFEFEAETLPEWVDEGLSEYEDDLPEELSEAEDEPEAVIEAEEVTEEAVVEAVSLEAEEPDGPAEPEATPELTEVPVLEAEAEAVDPGKKVFDSTIPVSGETWSGVDLIRADGFTGKLALVTGTLTLANVTVAGQPARSVNLPDHFDLAMGASIVVTDGAALTLDVGALSINKGAGRTLKATYNGAAVKATKVKWKTSAKKVATVSKKGRVAAKQKGAAVVTATYKGEQAQCWLDVTGVVYPKSVSVKKKLTLGLNNAYALKAKIKPANPDDATLTWTSTRPEIASVDAQGNVTGLAPGKATVTVTTSNGKKASCKVTIKAINPKSVSFQKLYVTMHPGEQYQSVLKMKPANASYTLVNYSSSDPAVATVDEAGVITAVGIGTATITAASPVKAKVTNTCKVCVIAQGVPQLEGLIIGINPGHQKTMIKKRYPMAPGSHSYGPGVKVGATGVSTRQTEYSVVLKIGLKLKRILEEHGAQVVITRTTNDVMLTNIDRAKMLNDAGVDVALQLHNNSCSNPSKTGESSYYRPNGPWAEENKALAIQLSKYISKVSGFKNRGINPYTNYMSLNWTTTPSVLLEMGYLSNSSDDHKLAKDSFQELLAQGIYEGLCAYFGR